MPAATTPSICIAGAGIAGLILAARLADFGWRPVVLEARRRESLLDQGLFLTLAPNGMNGLAPLGLAGPVAAAGAMTPGIELLNERGRRLGYIDQSADADVFGADHITIARSTLFAVLLEAAEARGVEVRFESPVTGLRQAGDRVAVESGGAWQSFDLAAACDGVRSHLRALAMPEAPAARFTGQIGTGGIADMPDIPATDGVMRLVFGHTAFFGYFKSGTGPVMWFNNHSAPAPLPSRRDPAAYADGLRAMHGRDPGVVRAILARVPRIERDHPIYGVPSLPVWHRGRVVLVGDAAHAVGPHAGQGAAMAIEDAVLLAACLRVDPGPGAFARWEAMRHARVAEVAARTARNGGQKGPSGAFARLVRRIILPVMLPIGIRAGRRLLHYRVDREPLVAQRRAVA